MNVGFNSISQTVFIYVRGCNKLYLKNINIIKPEKIKNEYKFHFILSFEIFH